MYIPITFVTKCPSVLHPGTVCPFIEFQVTVIFNKCFSVWVWNRWEGWTYTPRQGHVRGGLRRQRSQYSDWHCSQGDSWTIVRVSISYNHLLINNMFLSVKQASLTPYPFLFWLVMSENLIRYGGASLFYPLKNYPVLKEINVIGKNVNCWTVSVMKFERKLFIELFVLSSAKCNRYRKK